MTAARLSVTPGVAPPARRRPAAGAAPLSAWWLQQAGFLVECGGLRLVVDAYLSDTLAVKYRGQPFPHVRLVPPPVAPGALLDVDVVLATHGHTDHLDPGTLAPLAAANPRCRFVVPASCAALAISRGVPPDRLVPASAFAPIELGPLVVHPLPSAHEALALDGAGEHLHLGYVLEVGGVTLYHPGDCVPYPELAGHLSPYPVDLALLPVNGRDARRAAGGVPGNFDLDEAADLALGCRFGAVIGHHFGLFDFNTLDVPAARERLRARPGLPPFLLAEAGARYDLWPASRTAAARRGTSTP